MRPVLLAATAGVAVALLIAVLSGLPAADIAVLIGITATTSLVLAVFGRLVFLHRARSMKIQAAIVSATAAAVLTAGVVASAQAMFISTHDRNVLFVVTALALTASLAAALYIGSAFGTDAAVVAARTREIGTPGPATPVPRRFHSQEMAQLADRLAEADARVAAARQRERAVESSRRELVAWISHDLRSPLASIRALAEALEDGIVVDDEDVFRYHHSIRLESERLSLLVDDLFELSRLQAGAVRHDGGAMAVRDLVDAAVGGVDAAAEVKGIRVAVDVDAIGTVAVPATDVLRIVRNLLDNAVRHTPPGGTVTLQGRRDHDAVLLSVLDECGGIPDQDLPRLFDVAFRGDAARSRDGSSGGLGLTIAKGLAEAHAGTIDVGNLDAGCRFRLRIPAVP